MLHVDDLFAVGCKACLCRLTESVESKYECKIEWLDQVGCEISFCKRKHALLEGGILVIHPNPRHLDTLASLLGVAGHSPRSRAAILNVTPPETQPASSEASAQPDSEPGDPPTD